jgi:hypothetical protein
LLRQSLEKDLYERVHFLQQNMGQIAANWKQILISKPQLASTIERMRVNREQKELMRVQRELKEAADKAAKEKQEEDARKMLNDQLYTAVLHSPLLRECSQSECGAVKEFALANLENGITIQNSAEKYNDAWNVLLPLEQQSLGTALYERVQREETEAQQAQRAQEQEAQRAKEAQKAQKADADKKKLDEQRDEATQMLRQHHYTAVLHSAKLRNKFFYVINVCKKDCYRAKCWTVKKFALKQANLKDGFNISNSFNHHVHFSQSKKYYDAWKILLPSRRKALEEALYARVQQEEKEVAAKVVADKEAAKKTAAEKGAAGNAALDQAIADAKARAKGETFVFCIVINFIFDFSY